MTAPGTAVQLARITMREIELPLVEPFRSAHGTVTARRVLLLELAGADGTIAWSECVAESTAAYAAESVDSCWAAIAEQMGPAALDDSQDAFAATDAAVAPDAQRQPMARAAVEMGLWALAATRRGVPLARLLAGASDVAREQGAGPAREVATGIAIGMQASPDALVDRARAALAAGYRRLKLKVSPGRDVAYVRAVREALGARAPLAVDANASYTLADPSHLAALQALDTLGLTMIEQPLAADDLEAHAALQRRLATPVCLDESVPDLEAATRMIALGAGRMVNIKPGRVGGLRQAVAIHDRCAVHGIPVWCGGMLETGIGRAYNVALAALPNFTEPGDLSPSARYWARDIVLPPWTMDATGHLAVPVDRAGIGVMVDVDYIDALTSRALTLAR